MLNGNDEINLEIDNNNIVASRKSTQYNNATGVFRILGCLTRKTISELGVPYKFHPKLQNLT